MNLTPRAATTATLLLVVLCGAPRHARADYIFIPFIGGAFSGQTAFVTGFEQGASSTQLIFGGTAGWLTAGILGFEGDFSYAPRYFESDNIGGDILDSSAMTVSGSVIVAVPQSVTGYSLRPYVIGGLGIIRSSIEYAILFDAEHDTSLGMNVGAGAIGFLTPRTGVRFELRHFRTLERQEDLMGERVPRLSFWRFTVGVVIRR